MHKPESVLENETHKIIWDFEIKTDHPILARRPDLVLINTKKRKKEKENVSTGGLCSSSRSHVLSFLFINTRSGLLAGIR